MLLTFSMVVVLHKINKQMLLQKVGFLAWRCSLLKKFSQTEFIHFEGNGDCNLTAFFILIMDGCHDTYLKSSIYREI